MIVDVLGKRFGLSEADVIRECLSIVGYLVTDSHLKNEERLSVEVLSLLERNQKGFAEMRRAISSLKASCDEVRASNFRTEQHINSLSNESS